MKRVFVIIGLILLMALAGCSHHTAAPPSVSHHGRQDSIREKIVERIDTIKVMVPVEIPVERIVNVLPDTDTSILETSVAVSTAFIDSLGLLHHTLDNKAQTIEKSVDVTVPVSETTHEEFHSKVDSDTVYVAVPAQLSKGQKFLINMGWGAIAVLVVTIIIFVKRLWLQRRLP